MKIEDHWHEIKKIFIKTGKKNNHFAFATVDKNGNPHITPIGSLILKDNCNGFFFDRFPVNMKENFKTSDRVSVLTVNTGFFFWLKSIRKGKFESPPGIRLYGKVGELRNATEAEKEMWQKKVHFTRRTKGYKILWKDMDYVRDISFDDFKLVTAGAMTKGLWG